METLKASECRSCCPMANALDLLGDRWTLLVIRDMMFAGKHEYKEFMSGSEGVATNILAERLKRLCGAGVINCVPHPKQKTKKLYYLTQKGKDLLPLMMEIGRWGAQYRQAPDTPKFVLEHMKRAKQEPKKFMRETLREIEAWEKKNLGHVKACCV